jgi:hypothetical protein
MFGRARRRGRRVDGGAVEPAPRTDESDVAHHVGGLGSVFVSYAGVDVDYVRRLVDHLRLQGVPVWWDERINVGEQWSATLAAQIDVCAAFLVVMSPEAEASTWVAREINHAEHQRKPVFPLLLRGSRFFPLSELQYEDVTGGRMPGPGVVEQLRAAVQGRPIRVTETSGLAR